MKKYLFIYAAAITAALVVAVRHYHGENQRLESNQRTLLAQTGALSDRAATAEAEVAALRLKTSELRRLRTADAERIRRMGIRLRDVESVSSTAAHTTLSAAAPVLDTVVVTLRDTVTVRDTVRMFRWRDAWVGIEGTIRRDSVECRIESVDTLQQTVWRQRRRFLFIRWGTKSLRQRITSSNPHTKIVATEYIEIEN